MPSRPPSRLRFTRSADSCTSATSRRGHGATSNRRRPIGTSPLPAWHRWCPADSSPIMAMPAIRSPAIECWRQYGGMRLAPDRMRSGTSYSTRIARRSSSSSGRRLPAGPRRPRRGPETGGGPRGLASGARARLHLPVLTVSCAGLDDPVSAKGPCWARTCSTWWAPRGGLRRAGMSPTPWRATSSRHFPSGASRHDPVGVVATARCRARGADSDYPVRRALVARLVEEADSTADELGPSGLWISARSRVTDPAGHPRQRLGGRCDGVPHGLARPHGLRGVPGRRSARPGRHPGLPRCAGQGSRRRGRIRLRRSAGVSAGLGGGPRLGPFPPRSGESTRERAAVIDRFVDDPHRCASLARLPSPWQRQLRGAPCLRLTRSMITRSQRRGSRPSAGRAGRAGSTGVGRRLRAAQRGGRTRTDGAVVPAAKAILFSAAEL